MMPREKRGRNEIKFNKEIKKDVGENCIKKRNTKWHKAAEYRGHCDETVFAPKPQLTTHVLGKQKNQRI